MLLSVDPGVMGTGYAVWKGEVLLEAGTIKYLPRDREWEDKAFTVAEKFTCLLASYRGRIEEVIFEQPMIMGGAVATAVARKGDLVKLAMLVGILIGVCKSKGHAKVTLVTPIGWKGQLPKDVTERRISAILEGCAVLKGIDNHAMDAVGIGLWHQGRFE